MNLPKRVEVAPQEVVGACPVSRHHWQYFANTITDLGIELQVNPKLKAPCWGAFQFRVDGVQAAFDFSDFIHFDRTSWGYPHWFKRAYCAGHLPIKHLASFPPTSFLNWTRYRELMAAKRYTAGGSIILHKQSTPKPTCRVGEDLYRRRMKARNILVSAFGDRVDIELEPQLTFFDKGRPINNFPEFSTL